LRSLAAKNPQTVEGDREKFSAPFFGISRAAAGNAFPAQLAIRRMSAPGGESLPSGRAASICFKQHVA